MSSVFIKRIDDGNTYDLDNLGFRVITFEPPGTNYVNSYATIGKVGSQLTDTKIDKLSIPLTLMIQATDKYDLELKRLELKRIFNSDTPFYVFTNRTPYLRWKCIVEGGISYPQIENFWWSQATINLTCPLGLAETVGVTTDDDFLYSTGKWGMGLNLPHGQDLRYVFSNQERMQVYNASNIPLKADTVPMHVIFNGDVSGNLVFTNTTTNQAVIIKGPFSYSDLIEFDGLMVKVNGYNAYQKSDHRYIDFAKGWNEFLVNGASNFTIKFKTRFYY